jgi:hypothetical protein
MTGDRVFIFIRSRSKDLQANPFGFMPGAVIGGVLLAGLFWVGAFDRFPDD